jgi:NAD(P)-dependent dehydrogenase (short-subunit alcohol dehydrogenase family)
VVLEGKVVAVTGAASGIGRATAMLAARSGARGLVLADVAADALADAAAAAAAAGSQVETVTGSVADQATADEIVARAVTRFGSLDAAVNAAGAMGDAAEFVDYPDEAFDRVLDVNVRGVFRCMRAELRQMYDQGAGCVVNIASASVYGVHAELGPYVASKAAVVAMTKVAAKEAGRRGVRVNAVCPGLTDTPMLQGMAQVPGLLAAFEKEYPLGRINTIDDVAFAALFLAHERCYMTGQTLHVTGGLTLRRNPTQAEIEASIAAAANTREQ